MRVLLTIFFTVLGVFLTYLFMVSAAGRVPSDASLAVKLASPFKELDSMSLLCLEAAFASYLFAGFFKLSAKTSSTSPLVIRSHVLEVAFMINVLLIAGILAVFAAYASGWVLIDDMTTITLGALLGVAVLEALVGIALAVILASRSRARKFYYSVLSVHLMEVSLLGAILFVGFSK
jgi:hypothetical protein